MRHQRFDHVSQTGRFLSEDPIRFAAGDQNFYRYVRNNPVNLIDPIGLESATNSGQGAGGLPGLFNDALGFFRDTGAQTGLFDALNDFGDTLSPGESQQVDVLADPQTGEIIGVFPHGEPGIREPGKKKFGPFPVDGPPGDLSPPLPGQGPEDNPSCKVNP